MGEIKLIKENEVTRKVSNLKLDYSAIPEIKEWINSKLGENGIKFYRSTKNEKVEMK